MSYKKPGLLIFCACFQIIVAALTLPAVITLFTASNASSSVITIAVIVGIMSALMMASGIGLLKRQKWAKTMAIILFALFIVSGFYRLSQPNPAVTGSRASASYQFGYNGGQFLMYGGSGLGLYALTLNKSVKRYFDRDTDETSM
jgi:Predicted membrane protein (DUF2127)